jgi:hypothetical protein
MTRSILKNVSTVSMALGLAAGLSQITPVMLAQSPGQQSTPKTGQQSTPKAGQQSAPKEPGEDSQKTETFVGKIVKASNGQYALLTDEKAGKGAYLDDQEKAKQFEGKSVKVIGVMMASSNLIHVTDIQPA